MWLPQKEELGRGALAQSLFFFGSQNWQHSLFKSTIIKGLTLLCWFHSSYCFLNAPFSGCGGGGRPLSRVDLVCVAIYRLCSFGACIGPPLRVWAIYNPTPDTYYSGTSALLHIVCCVCYHRRNTTATTFHLQTFWSWVGTENAPPFSFGSTNRIRSDPTHRHSQEVRPSISAEILNDLLTNSS